mmetsp:Transcript_9208/g.33744  ORF Transcript_9208/g.33744 Transcript_9208/m.33744 type:complete len:367 (+) Transcript_9208:62-1162(+)
MLQLQPENEVLLNTLQEVAAEMKAREEAHQEDGHKKPSSAANEPSVCIREFDDAAITVQQLDPKKEKQSQGTAWDLVVTVEVCGGRPSSTGIPFDVANKAVSEALESVAPAHTFRLQVNEEETRTDEGKYAFDLFLQLRELAKLGEASFGKFCGTVCCLRALLQTASLKAWLEEWGGLVQPSATEEQQTKKIRVFPYCKRESMYVKTQADSLTVVLPIHMPDSNDPTIAVTFLQEFAEARRHSSLGSAPAIAYYRSTPPLEVQDIQFSSPYAPVSDSKRRQSTPAARYPNAGFVSLVLFRRHVSDRRRAFQAAWRILTFQAFVSYHVKASKAAMHTSMRKRVAHLLQVLNRAKPEAEPTRKRVPAP